MNTRRTYCIGGMLKNALLLFFSCSLSALASNNDCAVPDKGAGTIEIPPALCHYVSPQQVFMIIDGLPPGTTIELTPFYHAFFARSTMPGGDLGGEQHQFEAVMIFEAQGTGDLDGFRRILSIPTANLWFSAPRVTGDPVQSFDTEMVQLQGAIFGDPDFAQLQLSAGRSLLGTPSLGHSTLRNRGDGNFHVDSFFDVFYDISFVGAPGGALDGLSGSTAGITRLEAKAVHTSRRCNAADNGSATANIPPLDCAQITPQPGNVFQVINGLPPGTTIELEPFNSQFVCTGAAGNCASPGGNLGGERETFDSTLRLHAKGTGSLANFRRTLHLPLNLITDSAPRLPGAPVQAFPTDLFNLQGGLVGDPDFASLSIRAGTGNGLPSPGHTTLQNLGNGSFQVDSFFDVFYEVDFQGAPGSVLEGFGGSTTQTVRLEMRDTRDPAGAEDNGRGTATLPAERAAFVHPGTKLRIIDGLPPGATIDIDSRQSNFFCSMIDCGESGGNLGGEREVFSATMELTLKGTSSLGGFHRTISLPINVETHSAPRTSGLPIQSFDTDLFSLQGQLFGDPDFDELRITAGTNNGLPSPGHTTLSDLGNGRFQVDSFFDISYQIEFVGAPGGQLDGLSGTTLGNVRVEANASPTTPSHNITIMIVNSLEVPDDFNFSGDLGTFALDQDTDPALSHRRLVNNLPSGLYNVAETLPTDWILESIVCNDPDGGSSVNIATAEVLIDLDLGEAITCIFNNLDPEFIFADGFE